MTKDLAQACMKRAQERDEAQSRLLLEQCLDHERRERIARLLGVTGDYGPPDWNMLETRLVECLTTFRRRPELPQETKP